MNIKKIGLNVIDNEIDALKLMKKSLQKSSSFEKAVNLLLKNKGKLIITGMGKSGLIGQKIAATLTSTGTPAFYLNPGEASHGDLGIIMKNDIVIMLSKSGETDELVKLLSFFKRFSIKLILITSREKSLLAKHSNIVINLNVVKEACPLNLAPTSSTTAQIVIGDAIAVSLLKAKGFTKDDFAMFHPGGLLSKQLLKVKDLMHSGKDLPVAFENTKMRDVISIIIEKKLGAAVIINKQKKLKGIIVDGDLKRIIMKNENFLNKDAKEYMSRNPKTINKDELVAKALTVMEGKITSLIVTDKNKTPIGLLHIHDILKSRGY